MLDYWNVSWWSTRPDLLTGSRLTETKMGAYGWYTNCRDQKGIVFLQVQEWCTLMKMVRSVDCWNNLVKTTNQSLPWCSRWKPAKLCCSDWTRLVCWGNAGWTLYYRSLVSFTCQVHNMHHCTTPVLTGCPCRAVRGKVYDTMGQFLYTKNMI